MRENVLKKKNKTLATLFSITGVVLFTKLFGFLKQIVVAGTFGATIETDLISLSEGLTANIEYVIVQTLITAFVPIYLHAKKRNEEEAIRFTSSTIILVSLIVSALVMAIEFSAPLLARIIAPSYDADLTRRLTGYIRIFAPVLIFFAVNAIYHALLNANEHFIPGQLSGFNQSVIIITLIVLFKSSLGVNALALGFILYAVYNVCFLGFCSRKYWKVVISKPLISKDVSDLLRMIAPLLLGYAAIFINQQVDKIIVSGMDAGTVTALGYGATLSNFVSTLIGALCSVVYTRLSEKVATGDSNAASSIAVRSAGILISVFLPIALITIFCSNDIVSIAFKRGAFDDNAVHRASLALSGYAVAFVPYILKAVFSRLQYGHKNAKKPMINNTIGIACNIALSILLYKPLGVFGVAFASSVSETVSGVLNAISAKKEVPSLTYRPLLRFIPGWCASAGACVCIIVVGKGIMASISSIWRFLFITVISAVLCFLLWLPKLLKYRKASE